MNFNLRFYFVTVTKHRFLFPKLTKMLEGQMLALLLGLLAAFCWSISDLIARKLAPEIGALRMSAIAMSLAFLVMILFSLNNRALQTAGLRDWLGLLAAGSLYGIAVASLYSAFASAPVSIVGPLTAGYPAFIVIWGMMNGFRPALIQGLAVVAIVVGSIIVGRNASQDDQDNMIAPGKFPKVIFLCGFCSIGFAASLVMAQNSSLVFGEFTTAGLMHLPAALILMPMAWREKPGPVALRKMVFVALLAIAALDIIALTGINFMNYLPYKELGPMGISAYAGIAVVMAMVVLKETVTRGQWLGIALIILGVGGIGIQTT